LVKEAFDNKIRTEFQRLVYSKANPNEIEIKAFHYFKKSQML
jgi:hypothetical protein